VDRGDGLKSHLPIDSGLNHFAAAADQVTRVTVDGLRHADECVGIDPHPIFRRIR
jgi:hypothetical protein